jgi:hypothetical protein
MVRCARLIGNMLRRLLVAILIAFAAAFLAAFFLDPNLCALIFYVVFFWRLFKRSRSTPVASDYSPLGNARAASIDDICSTKGIHYD